MKTLLVFLIVFYPFCVLLAQQDSVSLYPKGGVPGAIPQNIPEKVTINKNDGVTVTTDIQNPKLYIYQPTKPNGTSVLICPGGGYYVLAMQHEGHDLAKWFVQRGITAFVLKSRLPDEKLMTEKHIRPLQDAQQAMRMIRRDAQKWKIDPTKVGIMGFSAGGHLAATVGTRFQKQVGEIVDEKVSVKPDFMLLIYPLISFKLGEGKFKGIQDKLLGTNASEIMIDEYCLDKQVTAETPPTFLLFTSDDFLSPEQGFLFYNALLKNKVPAEFHIYEKGGHGFSLSMKNRGGHLADWDKQMEGWLQDKGLLK